MLSWIITMILPFPHEKNVSLKLFTTLKIGGPARFLARARTVSAMQEMLAYCYASNLNFLILGKGSNTLFDDKGFDGLVILNKITTLEQKEHLFFVGGGYNFSRLGTLTAQKGWSGLEFACAIPATVGGAVYMNAGASGQETADVLEEVMFVDERGESYSLPRSSLRFGYRFSSFQEKKGAIVGASFSLHKSEEAQKKQKELLSYRVKTQPLSERSAGCAFRNPKELAAGKLIEECGMKGLRRGGAQVSPLHANFILNIGGATSQEILDLIAEVKERVYAEKKILLEEEIRYIPYDFRV